MAVHGNLINGEWVTGADVTNDMWESDGVTCILVTRGHVCAMN